MTIVYGGHAVEFLWRAMADEKQALVQYAVYSRVIRFTDGRLPAISAAILRTFSDIQPPVPDQMNIQMKREEWGGEFVDVGDDEVVTNRSVLKVCARSPESRSPLIDQQVCLAEFNSKNLCAIYMYRYCAFPAGRTACSGNFRKA